jgi:DNA-binding response OmpR family regulator
VILLDVLLPDGNGIDFCGDIQGKTSAHIIFLTSRLEHESKILGLDTGGDDYITKPYLLDEMLSRVRAALRRREKTKVSPARTLAYGNLILDIVIDRVYVDGIDLNLQPKEFDLLRLFAENEHTQMSADYIYEKLWDQPIANDKNAVQAAVSRLRKKIEHTDYSITNTRGKGYTFTKK